MSLPVRVALTMAELLAGGMLGAMAGVRWARRDEPLEIINEAATEDAERARPLVEACARTQAAVGRSLSAHVSLQARLVAVSDSALEHAQALERLHEAGLAPRGIRANADWRPPPELSRDLPRPGAPEAWQALDRSFDALLAALDEPQASCVDHAGPTRSSGAPRGRSPTGWPTPQRWSWRRGARSAPSGARTSAG